MKISNIMYAVVMIAATTSFSANAQQPATAGTAVAQPSPEAQAKADEEIAKKAGEWVAALKLNDAAKEARVKEVIITHLKTVRDWNNTHPASTVPAGIDPSTGRPLSDMDRQIIANSAMPKTVHTDLMSGLRKDLTEEQVTAILDQYTIGKVDFTMKGYKAIVPDLTAAEEKVIRGNLEQAREQAVDYKSMKQISAIFEIYKTKSEQYLNSNGRNWHEMFKTYVNAVKAKKAADQAAKPAQTN